MGCAHRIGMGKWVGGAHQNERGKSPIGVRCAHQNGMGKRPNWVGCIHQNGMGKKPGSTPFRMEYARDL